MPRIPTEIQLAALNIKTIKTKDLAESEGLKGRARYAIQGIEIDPIYCNPQTIEQTYVHEVVHWILHIMGRDDLTAQEGFVEGFSQLAYQAITSMKFEEEKIDSDSIHYCQKEE